MSARRPVTHRAATLGIALLLLGAPVARAADEWVTQARYVMGTVWTVETRGPRSDEAIEGAFTEIRRLDALLSTYRPESELSRVNRSAAKGWVPVSSETYALLERSFGYSKESEGAFDPTVGTLIRAWGFKYLDYHMPAPSVVEAARAKVGFRKVRLDPQKGVRFDVPGLELDLGAIAKGYAVDRALDHLKRMGAVSARVDAGGNQGVWGTGPTRAEWMFGIKHPREDGEILGAVPLAAGAVSTSGDAERGFWHEGVRYGHIVDPHSGRPVSGMLSVTVVSPTAEEADALSTALYVLGVEKGKRLLRDRHPGSHALFVQAGKTPGTFTYATSDGFRWHPQFPER